MEQIQTPAAPATALPYGKDQRYYDIAREGIEAATSVVRAGVGARDVVKAAFDVNRQRGCGAFVDWCNTYGWCNW